MSGNEKRFDKALVIFVDILGSQSCNDLTVNILMNNLYRINKCYV